MAGESAASEAPVASEAPAQTSVNESHESPFEIEEARETELYRRKRNHKGNKVRIGDNLYHENYDQGGKEVIPETVPVQREVIWESPKVKT